MAWVEIIPPERAEGEVLQAYQRYLPKGASRFREMMGVLTQEPQVLRWFASLTFGTQGAYGVTGIDARLVETLALTISVLNECHTCIAVHGTQLRQMSGSSTLTDQITSDYATAEVDARTRAAMAYAAKLTRRPEAMEAGDAAALRDAGVHGPADRGRGPRGGAVQLHQPHSPGAGDGVARGGEAQGSGPLARQVAATTGSGGWAPAYVGATGLRQASCGGPCFQGTPL